MSLKTKAKKYFSLFEKKDLQSLKTMFDQDVTLRDWLVYGAGTEAVLQINQELFESVDKITVDVKEIYESGLTIVAELMIFIDNEPAIPVVDIIKFGKDKKIQSIVAYRGN